MRIAPCSQLLRAGNSVGCTHAFPRALTGHAVARERIARAGVRSGLAQRRFELPKPSTRGNSVIRPMPTILGCGLQVDRKAGFG